MKFTGPVILEGEQTVDGRTIRPGGITFRTPIPLVGLPTEQPGSAMHSLGVVRVVERDKHGVITVTGTTEVLRPGRYTVTADLAPDDNHGDVRFGNDMHGLLVALYVQPDPAAAVWGDRTYIEVVDEDADA